MSKYLKIIQNNLFVLSLLVKINYIVRWTGTIPRRMWLIRMFKMRSNFSNNLKVSPVENFHISQWHILHLLTSINLQILNSVVWFSERLLYSDSVFGLNCFRQEYGWLTKVLKIIGLVVNWRVSKLIGPK